MRHLKFGKKLKRTYSHRKALLKNLAMDLIKHKKIETTLAKAKALRPFVERLITRAKKAYLWEHYQNEKNPKYDNNGSKLPHFDVFNRRFVGRFITKKPVLQELFETVAPIVAERPGGYTRIVKLGSRRGDSAEMAIIELVDWGSPQDGAVSLKSKAKARTKKTGKAPKSTKEKKRELTTQPQKLEESAPTPSIDSANQTHETSSKTVEESESPDISKSEEETPSNSNSIESKTEEQSSQALQDSENEKN